MNKVFIFAGSHKQAETLARWHDMARNEWIYVSDSHTMLGQRQQTMWVYGSAHFRPDATEIISRARMSEFKIFAIGEDDYFVNKT